MERKLGSSSDLRLLSTNPNLLARLSKNVLPFFAEYLKSTLRTWDPSSWRAKSELLCQSFDHTHKHNGVFNEEGNISWLTAVSYSKQIVNAKEKLIFKNDQSLTISRHLNLCHIITACIITRITCIVVSVCRKVHGVMKFPALR